MPNQRGTLIEPSELEQANPFPAGRFAEAESQEQRGAAGSRGRGSVPTRAVTGRPDSSTQGPSSWSGVNPLPPIDPSMPVLKPGDQGG
jgi:hypothetical protein